MRRIGRWAAAVTAVLVLSACSMQDTGSTAGPASTGAAGSKYRFSLKDLDGKTVTLDGLLQNHKAVLLNFWATWCPFCIEEMPELVHIQEKYSGRSFTVVGINAGESREDARRFLDKRPVNYPILLDTDMAVSETYGVIGLPTSMLVRADGKVIGVYHSVSPKLEADIEAQLV